MAWKHWLRGLFAAVIGGASSSLTMIAIDPADFNFGDRSGLQMLGKVALASAITHGLIYLKQHPDPWKGE